MSLDNFQRKREADSYSSAAGVGGMLGAAGGALHAGAKHSDLVVEPYSKIFMKQANPRKMAIGALLGGAGGAGLGALGKWLVGSMQDSTPEKQKYILEMLESLKDPGLRNKDKSREFMITGWNDDHPEDRITEADLL